ncbi:hypothetical protein SUDANB6_04138 [Streptomyces sp. enrichment culture]|uniref:BBE domain-containing protein n=1 Tax=Streptomyces sp. enrichment culture TaxID=1795815 RepID=UPI003F56A11C
MADPRHNRSGIPWHTLHSKDGCPRLQQVRKCWDPGDFFRHALPVEPAGKRPPPPRSDIRIGGHPMRTVAVVLGTRPEAIKLAP